MTTPTAAQVMERRIVERIVDDLTDRRGLRHEWDRIDEAMRRDIMETWEESVRQELDALSRALSAADALLDRCLVEIRHDIEAFGPCDHDVGCCVCASIKLADDIAAHRAARGVTP